MKTRIILSVLLMFAPAVIAAPATRPTTAPATAPADRTASVEVARPRRGSRPNNRPPATRPSLAQGILDRLASQAARNSALAKVAYIDLDREVSEAPASFAIVADTSLTLQSVIDRLRQARQDKDVRAVLLNLSETGFNLAQAQEIRDSLIELRKAGKRSFVYSDAYDTAGYIAASGSRDICMLPGGEIMVPGVGMEAMFARDLLDKVGVKADYVQIGQYKGADEPFTRSEPSAQMRGEMNKLLDSLYEQIVDGISYNRNLARPDVEEMINNVFLSGRLAKDRGFVDHLVDQDGLRSLIKKELGREVDLVHDYGEPARDSLDLSNPFALLGMFAKKAPATTRPAVGLIYAEGVIVDGDASDNIFGGGGEIGSEDIRKAMRIAGRDPAVKTIVLRIDSPGGSAMASEVMWQAVRRTAKEKPVVISVGGMAASGGYYLASAGDYIFADPSAIVGSIGVVGGKFVVKDLFDKLGLHTETFSRGVNADLFSSAKPFSDTQRRLVTNWMQQTYDQFTDRILTTRKSKIKDIDEVAHGRIFSAKQAREKGMVDELGGIEQAIAYAAAQAHLKADEYDVRVLPPTRTLLDLLRGEDPEAQTPIRPEMKFGESSVLNVLSPALRRLVRQQIQVLQLLQRRPVILVAPYVVNLK